MIRLQLRLGVRLPRSYLRMKVSRQKKWLIAAVALLVVLVGAPILRRRLLALPMDRCRIHRFDAAVWQDVARARSSEAVRGCMVDDLLERVKLHGRSRAEIVALLGEPPLNVYFTDFDFVYWLGPERGFVSIDSEWLVIKLDRAGRVSQAKLVTD